MRKSAGFALVLSVATLLGCSSTVLVQVPPRMELRSYGTLGIVEFASSAGPALGARATREFQAHIHAAQPGTGIVELGTREALLAAVGSRELDAEAVLTASLDLAAIRAQRSSWGLFRDRRPDLYEPLLTLDGETR